MCATKTAVVSSILLVVVFIASLARPGGNITGLSTLAPQLSGKQLELLKEIVAKLTRVAVLGTSTSPANAQALREVELAVGALKVQLQYLDIRSPNDIEPAFQQARKGRADAFLALPGLAWLRLFRTSKGRDRDKTLFKGATYKNRPTSRSPISLTDLSRWWFCKSSHN
jgi:ABC transporter substrate binding protein